MRALRKHKATLLRYTKPIFDRGVKTRGEETRTTIPCLFQPDTKGISELDLPQGVKVNDSRLVHSHVELKGSDNFDSLEADILVFQGKHYEVFKVYPWDGLGKIVAWEAIVVRRDV